MAERCAAESAAAIGMVGIRAQVKVTSPENDMRRVRSIYLAASLSVTALIGWPCAAALSAPLGDSSEPIKIALKKLP
jgi:hypothetical protein